MADVFISYSVKDREFVNQLHDELRKAGREAWVDWHSIPDSAPWRTAIFAGIEAAHNFVFVISPDSVASSMCKEELEHATLNKKRVISILFRPVNSADLPPPLAEIQAIPWYVLDDQTGTQRLIKAIETDLDTVRRHTWLSNRAMEWNARGRDPAYVLRGRDVDDAERWLNGLVDPAAVVRDFVAASRLQMQADERKQASQIAQRLTLEASALLARSPLLLERAALLAAEAAVLDPSREVDEVLRRCLRLLPRLVCEFPHSSLIQRIAFSRDGRFVATETGQKGDLKESRGLHVWPLGPNVSEGADPYQILGPGPEFSPNGGFRAVYSSDEHLVRVFSTDAESERLSIVAGIAYDKERECIRFSPDSTMLAVGDRERVTVWNLESRAAIAEIRLPCSALAFSPDGSTLAIASATTLELRAVETGHPLRRIEQPSEISAVEFDPTGSRVAIACSDGCAGLWTTGGEEVSRMVHRASVRRLAFDATGTTLATAVESMFDIDDTLRIWAADSGYEVERRPVASAIQCLFADTGERAILVGRGNVTVSSLRENKELVSLPLENATRASVVDDVHLLVLQEGELALWDGAGGQRVWSVKNVTDYACDQTHFVVTLDSETVELRQMWDAKVVLTFESGDGADATFGKRAQGPYAFSPDSRSLGMVIRDPARIVVIDAYTQVVRTEFPAEELMEALVWAKDGRRLAVTSPTRFAYKLQQALPIVATHSRPALEASGVLVCDTLTEDSWTVATDGFYNSLDFAADGNRFVGASTRGTAAIWDLQARARTCQVNHDGEVWVARFSPSGRTFATGSDDGTARLWNSETGAEMKRLHVGCPVTRLCFSTDEDYLFTFDARGHLRRWMLSIQAVVAEVRRRVTRSLTDDEWRQFIGTERAQPAAE